jgi:hypothetical protein
MGKWVLDRFELIYFDLKHKRWRLFQEDLQDYAGVTSALEVGSPGDHTGGETQQTEIANYRRNIQDFLHSIREAFDHIPKGTGIRIEREKPDKKQTITFEATKIAALQAALGSYSADAEPKDVLDAVLAYFQEAIGNEFPEKKGDGVRKFFQDFQDAIAKHGFTSAITIETTYATVLEALSILPILSHWDIAGALNQGWAGRRTTLLHEAGRAREPMYAAELSFPEQQTPTTGEDGASPSVSSGTEAVPWNAHSVDPGCNTESESYRLLGYEARLRVLSQDLTHPTRSPILVSEDDYYAYCHILGKALWPDDNKEVPGERALYAVFALFNDELQTLARPNAPKAITERTYYIAYPIITTLGRRHFLHCYLRPEDSTDAPLEDLWETWQRFHVLLGWDSLRPLLVSEMEHIDLAYFQSFLFHSFENHQTPDDIVERLCKFGHLLFPAERFSHCGVTYSYYEHWYPCDNGHQPQAISFSFGEKWRTPVEGEPKKTFSSKERSLPGYSIHYAPKTTAWDVDGSRILKQWNTNRCDRILLQQIRLAEQMAKLIAAEQRKRLNDVKNELGKLRAEVVNVQVTERRAAITAVMTKAAIPPGSLAAIQSRYQHYKNEEHRLEGQLLLTEDELSTGFVLLLETDIHTFISWYLESEPLHSICHAGKKPIDWQTFPGVHQDLHNAYREVINSLASAHSLIEVVDDFSKRVEMLFIKPETRTRQAIDDIRDTRREKIRSNPEAIAIFLNGRYRMNSWHCPRRDEILGNVDNYRAQLHLNVGQLWDTLPFHLVDNMCRLEQINNIKCCYFRVPLPSSTSQTKVDGTSKTIQLHRNCFAFAYSGGDNFCDNPGRAYPESVNDLVTAMNREWVGKLFFGFKANDAPDWTCYHITEANWSAKVAPFWNDTPIKPWFERLINPKTNVLIIGFDGWDCSG